MLSPQIESMTVTATGLPTGLQVNSNGTITGTPTTAGSYNAQVTINNGFGEAMESIGIVCLPKLTGYMGSDDGSLGAFVAADTIRAGSFMTVDETAA